MSDRRETQGLDPRITQASEYRILQDAGPGSTVLIPNFLTLRQPAAGLGEGSPSEAIIGTKTSGPRGVEAIVEYNGLLMNVRAWIDTFIVKSIAGLDDADIRDTRENNPDEDGETPLSSLYGGRTLTLNGKIETKTIWKLRDMWQALTTAFNDISAEKPLILRSDKPETDLIIYCKKHQKIDILDEQTTLNQCERSFNIYLRASYPCFLSYLEQFSDYNDGFSSADGDMVLFNLTNRGNYVARPKFVFNGPINAPAANQRAIKIVNAANGLTFWLKAGLSSPVLVDAAHSLEIDFTGNGVTARERDSSGAFVAVRNKFIDPSSDKILLEPIIESNQISVQYYGAGTIPHIEARYRHTVK